MTLPEPDVAANPARRRIAEPTDAEERRLRPAVWLREIVAAF